MSKHKKLLTIFLTVAMVFSLAACGGDSTNGQSEVIFNVAVNSGYDTMNAFSTESAMVYDWLNIMYDTLIAYDEDYNAVPRAAKEWSVSDDGKTWTFSLRDDIYFSDGQQLTSADVKWTYEHALDSYMYSTHAEGFESIECPDDFTVVFNCESPKPDMLYQIVPILPEHIWNTVEDYITYESNDVVGSGPFKYDAARSSNGSTAFVKNEDYWGDVPKIDVLVFTKYDNSDAIAQALKLGEVDAAYTLEMTQKETLESTGTVDVQAFGTFSFEYLGYNTLNELCKDKSLRHAIDYCIDRPTVIEMSYGNMAEPAYGPVSQPDYRYNPEEKRDLNIDEANKILDDAGYKDTDGDGIREMNGKKISLELITASERSSWQSATVNMLITNCKEAGIEITWTPMEKTAVWDTCYDGNPDWQLTLDGWTGDPDPGMIMCIFKDYETEGGYAGVSYQNPEFDNMYTKVMSTTDAEERAQYIEDCQKILYEDCAYSYLCFDQTIQAINSDKWTGYKAGTNGFFGDETNYNYCNITLK